MIHKQWRIDLVMDVLTHDEEAANAAVASFNRLLRSRIEGIAGPGVNISSLVVAEEPCKVLRSGTEPQLGGRPLEDDIQL